eukprot:CAMPEP_0119393936 /NCGR_PEP_ID=MMETSP1334-20130426/127217_1 /TAXON_ID=127549 /ORGANISM="Calcidiscus leptoporus, Strain RCC1130" /LENGTH=51 /DNA_ID=CAMNT_0007417095 /DNA_START=54 /DNA_END=206 /DNA_ORIENTATION=-
MARRRHGVLEAANIGATRHHGDGEVASSHVKRKLRRCAWQMRARLLPTSDE